MGRVECVGRAATTFQSHSCTNCNVTTCIAKFPASCGAKGAKVFADCIERTAWYVRVFPIIFVVVTIALLFYGFFIKRFDGYNPIPGTENGVDHRLTLSSASYASTGNSALQRHQRYPVGRLAPLSEALPLDSARTSDTGQSIVENDYILPVVNRD